MIHFNSSKILIPVDFSETSLLAIKHGAFLAQLTKGDVYLIHVVNKIYENYAVVEEPLGLNIKDELTNKVNERLNVLAKEIETIHGVNVTSIISYGNPTTEIIFNAKEINASLIVMGTHGYSPLEELVIGSNALKVITKSNCPVMTMSEKATKLGYSNILIPIDTTVHSRQKVVYAMEIAKQFAAHVHCVGLLTASEENERNGMEVIMGQIEKLAKEKHVICSTDILENVKNRAVSTIKYGEKVNADLIIIMTDQDAELSGFFLGPYSQQIIHLAKVPVIAIKPEEHPDTINFTLLSGTSGL